MSKRSRLCALFVSLAVASTASAQEAPRSPQRQRWQALSQRQPIPQTLCPLGELARAEGDLASARTHLTEGLERPFARTTTALGRKTVLFQCHLSLARVLAAQNDLDGAWTHLRQAWNEGASLPAARAEAATSVYLAIARRRWSGDRCAATWDISDIEAAERAVLGLLARQDDAGVRTCLAAIRARALPEHRGVCRPIERLPENTAAYAPTAASWTTLAPQLGAYSGDGVFLIARAEGATVRYVACEHGMSEYSARFTGARLGADGPSPSWRASSPAAKTSAAARPAPSSASRT